MSTTGITFGKVIAAAGVAVGAVLLISAMPAQGAPTTGIGEIFENIGKKLSDLFSGTLSKGTTALVGAGTAAGSLALLSSLRSREEDAKDAVVDAPQPIEGGFAEQIAMDRAMMRCRAAMVSQSPAFCAGGGRGMPA